MTDLERKYVIESHPGFVEHTNSHQSTNEGVALEEALGVLVFQLEKLTSSSSDLGQSQGDTPDLALVS
jgi:hypothetical protein